MIADLSPAQLTAATEALIVELKKPDPDWRSAMQAAYDAATVTWMIEALADPNCDPHKIARLTPRYGMETGEENGTAWVNIWRFPTADNLEARDIMARAVDNTMPKAMSTALRQLPEVGRKLPDSEGISEAFATELKAALGAIPADGEQERDGRGSPDQTD